MCDLQLLTGFAILISAYIQVPCTMSAYHWQIVVYLAWFSSITHLTGLMAARHYLYNKPWARFARIIASLLFLVMLLVAIVPTAYFNWDSSEKQPSTTEMSSSVACLYNPGLGPAVWHQKGLQSWQRCMNAVEDRMDELRKIYPDIDEIIANGTISDTDIPYGMQAIVRDPRGFCRPSEPRPVATSVSFQAMIYSVILLGWAFLSRFIRLWMPLNRFISLRIRRPLTRRIRQLIQWLESRPGKDSRTMRGDGAPHKGLVYYFFNRPLLAWLIFIRVNADCASSMFGELFWLSILILWGTLRLNATTNYAQSSGLVEGEQDWNFGQTLPVLLLVGPLLMVFRSFTTTGVKQDPREAWRQEQQLSRQSTLHSDPFLDHALTISRRASSELRSEKRERDAYKSSTWMGACLVACFISFSFMVGMTFGAIMDFQRGFTGTGGSIASVWISDFQLVVYLLMYYPLALHISILAGLFHDDLCRPHRASFKDNGSRASSSSTNHAPTCGHAKLLVPFIILLMGMFTAMFCVCQLTRFFIPGLAGSQNVVVLGVALVGLFYSVTFVVMLLCRRRAKHV
jgi:hypothetical protein